MSRPAGMGVVLYRFLLRIRVTTQIWWDEFAELWNKLPSTGSQIQDATIAGAIMGVGIYALHTDYEKAYNEAVLFAQNGVTGVIKQWLEDATGVRPATLGEAGLKDFAGRLVALHMANAYGTTSATAWPPEPMITEMKGMIKHDLISGEGRIVNTQKLEKYRKSIALIHNTGAKIKGLKGKPPALPTTRAKMLAAARQQRMRDKGEWYPYYGITPQMDAVLDDFLANRKNWTGR